MSSYLADWPGGCGEKWTCAAVSIIPLASARVRAWLEGPLLLLALAGPASELKNALLRHRLGFYVADCA